MHIASRSFKDEGTRAVANPAQCLGLCWESSLWQLLCDQACRRPLGPEHGVLAGEVVFRDRQEERCRLHLSRAGERADRVQVGGTTVTVLA